ncbi:MAG: flp pilus-assembly TadE/G-like family protein [Actinomycetaceae bacterium]|nr:flp pilus-assembly TadE/G-like family protein [Actinomycetaceae bacterium]
MGDGMFPVAERRRRAVRRRSSADARGGPIDEFTCPAGVRGDEVGAGTVLAAGAIALLSAVFLAVLVLLKGLSAMQRAQTAADMLALEAARRSFQQADAACPSADEVARYEVRLESCDAGGGTARIEVSAEVLRIGPSVRAEALAGTADVSQGDRGGDSPNEKDRDSSREGEQGGSRSGVQSEKTQ